MANKINPEKYYIVRDITRDEIAYHDDLTPYYRHNGLIKVSRHTIYRWIDKGFFPKPTKYINKRKVWKKKIINQWMNDHSFVLSLLEKNQGFRKNPYAHIKRYSKGK